MGARMTGMDIGQLKHLVVAPTLEALALSGTAAINLVTGTALAESNAAYLSQQGGGPALGLWQMEPATHDDCWANFLRYWPDANYTRAVTAMLGSDIPRVQQLVSNLRYACAMARLRYFRAPDPLPAPQDPLALSRYHKAWYNTALGAADATVNAALFARAIAA